MRIFDAENPPPCKLWRDKCNALGLRLGRAAVWWRRMSNPFYEPGAQRAARVNDLFGAIARRYDLINDLQSFGLHRRWKRRVAELAAVPSGGRALDLCCGTGDIAFALAANGAEVTGLDFSEAMLAQAQKRQETKGEVQHRTSN